MMRLFYNYSFCIALSFCLFFCIDAESVKENRNGKFLSMFEIIKFENDVCTTGSNRNGTCFSSQECEDKGGEKDGDCAQGYGVCCKFEVECGDKATMNNTYFKKSSGFSTGNCAIEFCPEEDVCQLRLDFTTFAITGPYGVATDTTSTKTVYGAAVKDDAPNAVASNMLWTQCNTDSFTISGSSGSNPPVICGTNTGEHMYIDAKGGQCVTLAMNLGGTSSQWDIQVTTLDCDDTNLAPSGCTQYFYGEQSGQFKTFNWAGGEHLANQNQRICFRQEKGNTKICYTAATEADFSVSVAKDGKGGVGYTGDSGDIEKYPCCGYGKSGVASPDCLQIPSAVTENDNCVIAKAGVCAQGGFCGMVGIFGTAAADSATANVKKSVCSKRVPFEVTFQSDGFETTDGKAADGIEVVNTGDARGTKGFQLYYIQS